MSTSLCSGFRSFFCRSAETFHWTCNNSNTFLSHFSLFRCRLQPTLCPSCTSRCSTALAAPSTPSRYVESLQLPLVFCLLYLASCVSLTTYWKGLSCGWEKRKSFFLKSLHILFFPPKFLFHFSLLFVSKGAQPLARGPQGPRPAPSLPPPRE